MQGLDTWYRPLLFKHSPLAHRTVYFLWSRCLGPSRECSFKRSRHFTKAGSSSNVFFRLYISQCFSFCLFGNSTPIKMFYFKLVASLFHDIENHCVPPNISELFTRSEQVHSYSTRFSVAGSFYIKQTRTNHQLLYFSRVSAKIWNGIPPELRKLRKAPFKRKLTYLLLKILETEEMNVDMRYIDLSSFPAFSLTC